MKTTVDAFGAEVIVGDLVVFKGQHKYLEKGLVVKCTPHGATVACGIHKTNVRSERICKVLNGQQRLGIDTPVWTIDILREAVLQ
jgi:hypothetical protein